MPEYKTLNDYATDVPPLVERIIELAREKRKEEYYRYAEAQAQTMQAQYPDHADQYSAANNYGYSWEERQQYEAECDAMYGDIGVLYDRFAKPDPADFDPLIQSIKDVENRLAEGTVQSHASTAQSELASDWDGDFSTNLRDNLLGPMLAVPVNLQGLAQSLRDTLEANQAIYLTAQNNVYVIAQKTVDALEMCGEKDPNDTKVGLAILAALTAVGSVAITGVTAGLAAPVALATISATASFASGFVPASENLPLGSETVDGVIGNMQQAIEQAYGEINDAEDQVIGVLEDNYEEVSMHRNMSTADGLPTPYSPMRPTIADAQDPTSGLRSDD